ncbi:hypothetical protein DSO57_1035248 [Entomophthora muscae]|uniref:Uncharacterized protein n=1 Tax=Entomophthora muscae TaxID=34485 RepID=A0ACC2S212_9FUNG|nr:hypothetical protein DSO57_1035248 [Entomophthora muscae]
MSSVLLRLSLATPSRDYSFQGHKYKSNPKVRIPRCVSVLCLRTQQKGLNYGSQALTPCGPPAADFWAQIRTGFDFGESHEA